MSLPFDPNNIAVDEIVSHFLMSKSDFAAQKGRVKPRSLEPSRTENSISVFRIRNLTAVYIWGIGQREVAVNGQTIKARADLLVSNILTVPLGIRRDEPPIRHADVFGWPSDKDAIMAAAIQLAADAELKLVNE